jgi:hypothetical protein
MLEDGASLVGLVRSVNAALSRNEYFCLVVAISLELSFSLPWLHRSYLDSSPHMQIR